MQSDRGGRLAEARLDGVVAGHTLRVDVHADDNFAAVALFKIGFGIDERAGDIILSHFVACYGLRCRDLSSQVHP